MAIYGDGDGGATANKTRVRKVSTYSEVRTRVLLSVVPPSPYIDLFFLTIKSWPIMILLMDAAQYLQIVT